MIEELVQRIRAVRKPQKLDNSHSAFHSFFPLFGVTSGDCERLPSQRPALSSSQFNKTAPFMLLGFSSGNGFSQ